MNEIREKYCKQVENYFKDQDPGNSRDIRHIIKFFLAIIRKADPDNPFYQLWADFVKQEEYKKLKPWEQMIKFFDDLNDWELSSMANSLVTLSGQSLTFSAILGLAIENEEFLSLIPLWVACTEFRKEEVDSWNIPYGQDVEKYIFSDDIEDEELFTKHLKMCFKKIESIMAKFWSGEYKDIYGWTKLLYIKEGGEYKMINESNYMCQLIQMYGGLADYFVSEHRIKLAKKYGHNEENDHLSNDSEQQEKEEYIADALGYLKDL